MYRYTFAAALAALLFSAVAVPAGDPANAQETINPADFSNVITNPYFPMSALHTLEYEGTEEGDGGETIETSGVMTVLPDAKTVAGVAVLVVRDQAYADGELVESTLDYFAQHRDGTVYYFGEDVDNYENGVVVDHDGSWLAGEGENLPGVFMPAAPAVGDTFDQERAPGIAEDHSEVVATALAVTVPAGSFTNCIQTEDTDPLADPPAVEDKFYCPSVGLVREQAEDEGEESELVSYTAAVAATPTVAAPTAVAPAPTATAASGIVAPNTGSGSNSGDALKPAALVIGVALLLTGWAMMRRGRAGRSTLR